MPTYTIELPDGRVMDAEAPNEAAAMAGARQWFAANPRWATQPPPQPAGRSGLTWGQWAEDLITGRHTTAEPGAREFQEAALNPDTPPTPEELARLPRGRDPQTFLEHVRRALGSTEFDPPPPAPGERAGGGLSAIFRSAVTPDPAAQFDILRRNIPDLESRTDRHGNLMLRSRSLGVTEWAYLNKPGVSGRDLEELATGTLVTLPFLGMFGQGANLGQRVLSSAVAGAGASLTQDAAAYAAGSEQGPDPLRAVIGGGIGAALAPGVPSAVGRAVARPFQRAAPAMSDTERQAAANALRARAEAGETLTETERRALAASDAVDVGVALPRAATSQGERMLGQATAQVPFLGRPITKATETATGQIDEAVGRVVSGLGSGSRISAGEGIRDELTGVLSAGARTVTDTANRHVQGFADDLDRIIAGYGGAGRISAGEGVRGDVLGWIRGRSQAEMDEAYGALRALINPNTTVPLSRTQAAVQRLTEADIASASGDGQAAINLVQQAIGRAGGLTFDGIRELRTRINDRLSYDLGEHSVSQRALRLLKGALDEDLRFAVQRAGIAKSGSSGRKALAAFEAANRRASEIFETRNALERIIGREGTASAEAIVDRLISMAGARGGDISRLAQVQNIVGPEAWGELASAALRVMGRTAEGFSAARLRTAYGNLSDNGRALLFGSGPPRRELDALMARAGQAETVQAALRTGSQGALEEALMGDAAIRAIATRRAALSKVLGNEATGSAEGIVDRLITMAGAGRGSDVTRLAQVKNLVGSEAWDDLASAALRAMGQTKDGLSIARLRTAYEGNLSANGRDFLFGRGEWRQSLDKIMRVAGEFEQFARMGNPSGTARTIVGIGAVAGGGLAMTIAHPFMVIGGAAGHYALARWLSRPLPAAKVARWMQAYTKAATEPSAVRRLVLAQASRELAELAGSTGEAEQVRAQLDEAARALERRRDTIGPWETAVQREPDTGARADLAGNQTYQALIRQGVHPSNAAAATRNPQLFLAMQRNPDLYREPGTPAERLIAERASQHSAIGGIG